MGVVEKLKERKEKILLFGHTGTGKTYSCVKITIELAKKGKKICYIDTESGSIDEFSNYEIDSKTDKNIILIEPKDFGEIKQIVQKAEEKVDVIVIDPLRAIDEVRHFARKKFLEKGKYWIGEKEIPIDDPDTFYLRGFMYQLPNELINEFFRELVRGKAHLIATELVPISIVNTPKGVDFTKLLLETEETRLPSKLKHVYDLCGWFDRVIITENRVVSGESEYYGVIFKWRGKNWRGQKIDSVSEFLLKKTKLAR